MAKIKMQKGYNLPWSSLVFFGVLTIAMAIPSPPQERTSFVFDGFDHNISDIILRRTAVLDSSGMIHLTNLSRSFGRALYRYPIRIKTDSNITNSFSTTFVISIVPLIPSVSGHGMAFFMTPTLDDSHVSPAQYLGLLNSSTNGNSSNHLFAVEFDTLQDLEFHDINNNHVGINLNGMVSIDSAPAAYRTGSSPEQSEPLNLKSGKNMQVWIHYDGLGQQINVSIAIAGQPEPLYPLLSTQIALSAVLENSVYVGFSGSSEVIPAVHSVLAWSFNSNGPTSPLDLVHLPSRGNSGNSISTGAIAGLTLSSLALLCVLVYAIFRWYRVRRQNLLMRKEELLEDWGLEYNVPHRFSYKEISTATKKFAKERLVGEGGFGVVYRGVILGTGAEVAVKRLSSQSQQGEREFMAELSCMGRLRHRNLVHLQGWGRREGELFLVYEYMSNGSLDKALFHSDSGGTATSTATATALSVLSWNRRYSILKDVAAALVYLHEGWEQQVIHRDVKSNNILLDARLNAKLGDFGLARLHEHGKNSHTTLVVGTLGYLAPEYSHTGKATASSDAFSFGVVMLEMGCGRRALDFQREDQSERILLDWVRGLLLQGRLLDACDPKLCGHYVKEEMERVLQLGLLCSHPMAEARPAMRQVLQILTGIEPLPDLPPFESFDNSESPSALNWSILPKMLSLNTSLPSYHINSFTQITGR